MADIEKVINELEERIKVAEECMGNPMFTPDAMRTIIALLKEQDENLKEYEKLSKTLFKIDKYFRIKDLEFLVDGIENGSIVVLQDDGHFIGGTPIMETTIKIRRL